MVFVGLPLNLMIRHFPVTPFFLSASSVSSRWPSSLNVGVPVVYQGQRTAGMGLSAKHAGKVPLRLQEISVI